MKRKNCSETVVSNIRKTSSSILINRDHDSSYKPNRRTSTITKKSLKYDTNSSVITTEKTDSEPEESPKLKIHKATHQSSTISSSSSSKHGQTFTSKPRIKLRAKRQCTSTELKQKESAATKIKPTMTIVEEEKNSKDTMQMKLLREKIKLRQTQGNAPRKTKIIKDIEIKKETSPEITNNRNKRSNNNKVKKDDDKNQSISRRIKEELIDIENQSNSDKDSDKIRKLKNKIQQIDRKTVVPASNTNSINIDRLSVPSSVSLKHREESSNYVIPKIKKSPIVDVNSNQTDYLDLDRQQNRLTSAPGTPKIQIEYYKNAEERMKALRSRLSAEIEINKSREATDSNNVSNTNNRGSFCEEMDWEPIKEEQIIHEVQVARAQLEISDNKTQTKVLSYNDSNELTINADNVIINIVIDTNVLLSSIKTVEQLLDTSFGMHGKPTIVVPWTVIRELDYIKCDKMNTGTQTLKNNARQAISFLYDHFSKNHPQFKGQSYQNSMNNKERFALECPDDEILQVCLQIQLTNPFVFLLSFDKNLCNKAMIHNVTVLGKDNSVTVVNKTLQKINNNNKTKRGRVKQESVTIKEEIKIEDQIQIPGDSYGLRDGGESPYNVEDIYEETKDMLTAFLTVIVSSELKITYGDEWEKCISLKPPWTAITALQSAVTYFNVVISAAFSRKAEPILKTLLQLIDKLESNARRQLKDIQYIIELFNDLIQYLKNDDKYQHILQRSTIAIGELRNKCIERLKQPAAVEKRKAEMNFTKEEQEMRATRAFECFENIYRFMRNFCGTALDIARVPCSFPFNKVDLSDEFIRINCPDVIGKLNQIILALNNILENLGELHINHKYVIELYVYVTNFFQRIERESISDQLLPEDIYYCFKCKEANLKSGFEQFVEISNHFAYMTQRN